MTRETAKKICILNARTYTRIAHAFSDTRTPFDVRFYLIAILFILFDLEIAFLFPWAAIFKDIVATESIKLFGFVEMLVFVAILVVGYIYAWAKGALEWE